MLHEFKIAYYLRDKKAKNKSSILLAISYGNSQRDIITTGLRINPINWNYKKQTCSNRYIKDELLRISQVISDYEKDIRYKNPRDFDKEELKSLIYENQPERLENEKPKDLFADYIQQYYELNYNLLKHNTRKKYPTLKRFFENTYPNLRAIDFNLEFAQKLKAFYLNKQFSDNYISKNFQLIRNVIKWLFDNKKLKEFDINKFTHTAPKKVDEIYLTDEEIKMIEEIDLSSNKSYDLIRDLFLLACYTGTDHCDLYNLSKENLKITPKGNKYFLFKRAKSIRYKINSFPLWDEKIEAILKKYNWKLPETTYTKTLTPLKEIAKLAGIKGEFTKTTSSGSREKKETKPRHEFVAWKTARRTYITGYTNKKMPIELIAESVGHTGTDTTEKYNHSSEAERVDRFAEERNKIIKSQTT